MVENTYNGGLAIVIPAYKLDYLRDTLDSLKMQTNHNFSVYIGDDNSPSDLWNIVKEFTSDLNIIYKKFGNNLGGTDLVAHWNRCISLVGNEEWIWLFSDDDLLEPNCIECFYNYISLNPKVELVHFDVKVIDKKGVEILDIPVNRFPKVLSSVLFFEEKIRGNLQSFVVEYIFKRSLFDREGGFANFDLAWCADDATWIKFAAKSGIYTIDEAFVYWRYSGINISSLTNNLTVLERKLKAKLDYLIWVKNFLHKNNIQSNLGYTELIRWFLLEVTENRQINLDYRIKLSFIHSYKLLGFFGGIFSLYYIIYFEFKKKLAKHIKQYLKNK
ncbi:GT2 family glycosyltransferase [Arcicella rosea]|uniref:glycosyltransferase family A protein n=1 Tax=Arcicella rosea TaxID=502909 RepID=UPI00345D8515